MLLEFSVECTVRDVNIIIYRLGHHSPIMICKIHFAQLHTVIHKDEIITSVEHS